LMLQLLSLLNYDYVMAWVLLNLYFSYLRFRAFYSLYW
jgi:hypothetical protein